MGLTQVSTNGVKDDAITSGKIPANAVGASELADNAVDTNAIANNAVTAGKTSGVQTTINNNADNRVITGSGTANTLNAESNLTFDGSTVTIGANAPKLKFNELNDNPDYFINANAGELNIHDDTNGSTKLTITATKTVFPNNNVGIGTTNPANLLDVRGSAHAKVLIGTTGTSHATGLQISHAIGDGGLQEWQLQTDATADGNLIVRNATSGTSTMFFDADNNNVGIGTTSPHTYAKLTVNDPNGISVTGSTQSRIVMQHANAGTNLKNFDIQTADGHLRFRSIQDNNTSVTTRMRLGSNGALGINGNANRMIHVIQGSSNGTVGVGAFENADSSNNNAVMFFATVRDGNAGESFLQCNRDQDNNGQGVSAVAFIRTNGDFDSATNSYGGTSDITLKENIVDAKSQWDDIKNIRVRNFNFKDNPNQKMLGVVAQEIETVCSGLVKETSDEGTTVKTVKYSILYMKAIKGLQEAMTRIETLEAEVAALKAA